MDESKRYGESITVDLIRFFNFVFFLNNRTRRTTTQKQQTMLLCFWVFVETRSDKNCVSSGSGENFEKVRTPSPFPPPLSLPIPLSLHLSPQHTKKTNATSSDPLNWLWQVSVRGTVAEGSSLPSSFSLFGFFFLVFFFASFFLACFFNDPH